jgi:hypothetical protein
MPTTNVTATTVPTPAIMAAAGITPVNMYSTATAMKLAAILNDYDKQVVRDAHQLRTYITNKLIVLSASGNHGTELRALELLGKTSDVGLFLDKSEVTVVHTNSADLGESLKTKIQNILSRNYTPEEPPVDAEFEDVEEEEEEEEEDDYDPDEDTGVGKTDDYDPDEDTVGV